MTYLGIVSQPSLSCRRIFGAMREGRQEWFGALLHSRDDQQNDTSGS
jgi:hypothetical protein